MAETLTLMDGTEITFESREGSSVRVTVESPPDYQYGADFEMGEEEGVAFFGRLASVGGWKWEGGKALAVSVSRGGRVVLGRDGRLYPVQKEGSALRYFGVELPKEGQKILVEKLGPATYTDGKLLHSRSATPSVLETSLPQPTMQWRPAPRKWKRLDDVSPSDGTFVEVKGMVGGACWAFCAGPGSRQWLLYCRGEDPGQVGILVNGDLEWREGV